MELSEKYHLSTLKEDLYHTLQGDYGEEERFWLLGEQPIRQAFTPDSPCGDAEEQLYRLEGQMEALGQAALYSNICYYFDRITQTLSELMFDYGVQCGLQVTRLEAEKAAEGEASAEVAANPDA